MRNEPIEPISTGLPNEALAALNRSYCKHAEARCRIRCPSWPGAKSAGLATLRENLVNEAENNKRWLERELRNQFALEPASRLIPCWLSRARKLSNDPETRRFRIWVATKTLDAVFARMLGSDQRLPTRTEQQSANSQGKEQSQEQRAKKDPTCLLEESYWWPTIR